MRSLTASLAALLLLAGCGGGGDESAADPQETVTVFSDPTAAATESEGGTDDSQYDPNVGDRALQVGEPRKGMEVTTTLLEVRDPYPPVQYKEPAAGNRYVGLRISQCVIDDPQTPPEQIYTTYNGEFVAVTADGDEYPGSGTSYSDFPTPKFPESVTQAAGSCVKGWLALELGNDIDYDKIVWRPQGQTVAEWIVD